VRGGSTVLIDFTTGGGSGCEQLAPAIRPRSPVICPRQRDGPPAVAKLKAPWRHQPLPFMTVIHQNLSIATRGQGTYEITDQCAAILRESGLRDGMLTVFCRHTSCSLVMMENADPTARRDLEAWLNRLVPENDRHFEHTLEGADDMPSHIKMALTHTSENIPFAGGQLLLGTWQGIFLWEHRRAAHTRTLVVTVLGA
jgi:secondary thiamine-phosphate synthase enzyme